MKKKIFSFINSKLRNKVFTAPIQKNFINNNTIHDFSSPSITLSDSDEVILFDFFKNETSSSSEKFYQNHHTNSLSRSRYGASFQRRFYSVDNNNNNNNNENNNNNKKFKHLPANFHSYSLDEKKQFVLKFLKEYPNLNRDLLQELSEFYSREENDESDLRKISWFLLKNSQQGRFPIYLFFAILLFGLAGYLIGKNVRKRVKNFQEIENLIEHGLVEKIVVHKNVVEIYKVKEKKPFYFYTDSKEFEKMLKKVKVDPKYKHDYPILYRSGKIYSMEQLIVSFSTLGLTLIGLFYLVNSVNSYSDSVGDIFVNVVRKAEIPDIKFSDIAGLKEQKLELMEYVSFIKDFENFQKMGCTLPRGCLVSGPAGCGKTMLAKALAGECGVPFYSKSGSDFVEMIVGIGPQRVRELFKEARNNQPCVIFIDEIDAVGSQRGKGQFLGRNDERENTLNQLLIEMDGFDTNLNVVVLAATNRPQILDSALLRPGRFDRKIEINPPTGEEREEIFDLYLKNIKVDAKAENLAKKLSKLTPGMSGAEIYSVVNEAALLASREELEGVELRHFFDAIDKILIGLKKPLELSEFEKKVIAYHEAGHAIVAWNLENATPVQKVSIIPRSGGTLGFTQQIPMDRIFQTKQQMLDAICVLLGGRASEFNQFNHLSTGARNDLTVATNLAKRIITTFGMNEKIGNIYFPESSHILEVEKPYSDYTGELIDLEIKKILKTQYDRCLDIIKTKEKDLEEIVNLLFEKETIYANEMIEKIGSPAQKNEDFEEYLENLY